MGLEHVTADYTLTRGPAQVATQPLRVAGQAVDVHGVGDIASMSVQVSDDGHNWVAATDADGAAITMIWATNWYREIRERSEFMRGVLAAGNLSRNHFRFGVHKAVN